LRNVIRWAFLLLAIADIAASAPTALQNWRGWRYAPDPVAAQFWRSAFFLNLTELGIVIGVAVFVWFALKLRPPRAQV
jgi:hypothetical protein